MKNTTIKNMFIPFLLVAPVWLSGYTPKKEKAPATRLELSGQVCKTEKFTQKNIRVYLIEENHVIDSLVTETGKTFKFSLQKDKWYSVRVLQPGHVTRLVSISTHIPKDIKANPLYKFHFDLFQVMQEENDKDLNDVLDFPVALIKYDEIKGYFDYNAFYTSQIKNIYNKLKKGNKTFFASAN